MADSKTDHTPAAPFAVVRTPKGALDLRRMGVALARDARTHAVLDLVAADSDARYTADPTDLSEVEALPVGPAARAAATAAANDTIRSREGAATAILRTAVTRARATARKAQGASVRALYSGALALPAAPAPALPSKATPAE